MSGEIKKTDFCQSFETVKKGTDREEKEHSDLPPLVRGGVERSRGGYYPPATANKRSHENQYFHGISSLPANSLSTVPLYADEREFTKSALFFESHIRVSN